MAPLPATLKRIQREITDVQKEDMGAIALTPSDNLFQWNGSLPGPEGSVYEGGVFSFAVTLPPDYPFSAPKVTFKTKIYHMNISDQGNICLDILKHNWSPALSLFKVILSLSSLLTDPNPKDPLVPSIAMQYTRNRKLHDSTARQWTELYARPKPPPAPPRAVATSSSSKTRSSKKATKANVESVPSSSRGSPIVIDDSDVEESGRTDRKKRKATEIVDDDDVVEVVGSSSGGGKKRAVGERRPQRTGDAGSSSQSRPLIPGDVIDID